MTVLSHSRDTIPAHEAAEYMTRSGKALRHKARIIEFISKNQGMTAAEAGKLTGLGHIEAQRRISDLKNDGLVEYRDKKRCPINKTSMSTVYLTARGADVMNARYIGVWQ